MSAAKGINGPILACIDLAEATDEVLAQADAIAGSLKTRLVVCHVLHEMLRVQTMFPQFTAVDVEAEAALERRIRDAIAARLRDVAPQSADDAEIVVEYGTPHAGILRQIDRVGAGLAVLGAGHVAERVTRYAPCAVLVARPSPKGGVLGASDLSQPSLPAIEMSVAEARRRGAPLRLLYCSELSEPILLGSSQIAVGVVPALPGDIADELERSARERLEQALAQFDAAGECLVTRGTAAHSIVEAATVTPTELIVIGMRGRSNVSRLLLGTVAETVLRTAPCSVVVVRLTR